MSRLRLRGGIVSGAPPPDPPPGGEYTFPTTAFDFPLLTDDGGTSTNDGFISLADYGLVPNSVGAAAANRAALQTMIDQNEDTQGFPWSKKTIFVPNGTWWLSGLGTSTRGIIERRNTALADPNKFLSGLRIQGQSESGAILRIIDSDPSFQNAADPRFVIFQSNYASTIGLPPHKATDGTGLGAYKNIIRDLTIDLGQNNPGAVGVNVMMHNMGAIRRVTVQDAVGAGRVSTGRAYAGFTEERQGAGPNLLHRLTVKGCEYGFRLGQVMCGQAIEHLKLEKQGTCGVVTDSNGLFIRGLVSNNTVPVAEIRTGTSLNHFTGTDTGAGWVHSPGAGQTFYETNTGYLLIVDAILTGTGAASTVGAIRNQSSGAQMFLRNVTTTGYLRAAQENGGAPVQGGAANLVEYATSSHNLWGQTPTSLNMTIRNTPEKPWSNISQWTSVTAATPGFPNGVQISHAGGTQFTNTWAALQSAIDNCTVDTLYIPPTRDGRIRFTGNGTIHIRGNVKHFVGFGAEFWSASGESGNSLTIICDHPTRPPGSETVWIEDLRFVEGALGALVSATIQVATPRDVVVQDVIVSSLTNTAAATGAVFIEDVVSGQINFANPQDVYSRQHNADGSHLVAQYSGGDFWCLYVKSEPQSPSSSQELPVNWTGRIEILGGWICLPNTTVSSVSNVPIFEVTNGAAINAELSVAGFATSPGGQSGTFSLYATETQNAVNRDLLPNGSGNNVALPDRAVGFHHMTLYRSKQ